MNRMLLSCTSINGLVKVVCGKKLHKIAILNTKNPEVDRRIKYFTNTLVQDKLM